MLRGSPDIRERLPAHYPRDAGLYPLQRVLQLDFSLVTEATQQPRAPLFESLNSTLSLRNERLFLAIVVLSFAPLWVGSYLPMVDMPQHAAQIAALSEVWRGNEMFTQLFEINWFTPYLLGYLLLAALDTVLPMTVATQVIITASLLAMPLLTGRLLRVVGADERWKWLAIPCSFGFAFYWGFLSFLVAAPLALVLLIRTVRYAEHPTLKSGLGIALFAHVLFFCHIIVLGFASLIAFGYVAGKQYRNPKALVVQSLPFAAVLPLLVVWFTFTMSRESSVQDGLTVYGFVSERFAQLLVQPAGHESPQGLLTPVITAAVVLLPLLAGCSFSRKPERWLPFALGFAVFMLAPRYVFTTAYFFHRLGLFLVPLWLMIWDPPQGSGRRLDWAAIGIVLLWSFTTIGRFAAFASETASFRAVVAQVEPGRRVGSMVYENASPYFSLPLYMHFPAWYAATGRGIVDFNFADFISQLVRYRKDAGKRMTDELGWYPTQFDWSKHGGERYDYFIVKSRFDVSQAIFKEHRGSVELVTRSGWWWLYRNLNRAVPTRSTAASAHAVEGTDGVDHSGNR